MPRIPRPEIAGVALLLLLGVVSLAGRDLFVGDETKYAQVVREMHADGELLLPTLNGEPYTHKPPLHFWMMYVLTAIGGQRAIWPYVLPALLSGIALVWMTGRIAADWLGQGVVWPARFFLAGLALIWGLAQTARMDLLFACLTTAGAVHLFRYLDRAAPRDGLLAGVWFGVAGLVKGPMAILILASLVAVECIARRRRPRLGDLIPGVVAAIVPLAWFVPAVLHAGRPYLEEIVMRQTAGRVVGSWVHREPPWYYIVGAPVILFPWFFVLLAAIRTSRRVSGEERRMLHLSTRWILAIVIPFSLISSKLPVYMVPALPPVALLAGWYASLDAREMKWRGFALWGNRGLLALLALAPVIFLSGMVPIQGDGSVLLEVSGIQAGLVSMAAIAIVGLAVGWRSVLKSSIVLPFVVAVPIAVMLTTAHPSINDVASSRLLADKLAQQARPGESIGMYYTPHLWSRSLPRMLEDARQMSVDELEGGARPDVFAVRADKVDRLETVLEDYREVSSVELMGKRFNVYRRR